MTPLDLHFRTLALLGGEPSRRGAVVIQGVALHDGECLTLDTGDRAVSCIVPNQLLPLTLPVMGRLRELYPGADYYAVAGDHVLQLMGRPADLMPRLFSAGEAGRLLFGFGASSVETSELDALEWSVVWFRELVMERLAIYGLSVGRRSDRLLLSLHLRDLQRAAELTSWVRWSLVQRGFALL